ncbi:hypothetical protein DSL72_006517 [Monilinia vaccinii-corymbosi]|uniref:Uncharacterized protein n=1 Tax=Monilinia vaccinii-corymbosi TaxID=61207 RepID=A0A8A3PP88_9HELO|nr:hypothetical protein DSL72_006517 [Monilinia vaccinii-corymbosi]
MLAKPELGKDSSSKSSSLKRKAPEDTSKTVTMLVSSKHMTLASPVFDAILSNGRFKEGTELLIKGKVEIELPDDDPVAFAIGANVIHHRNKMVPVELDTPQILPSCNYNRKVPDI